MKKRARTVAGSGSFGDVHADAIMEWQKHHEMVAKINALTAANEGLSRANNDMGQSLSSLRSSISKIEHDATEIRFSFQQLSKELDETRLFRDRYRHEADSFHRLILAIFAAQKG